MAKRGTYLRLSEVIEILNISESTFLRLRKAGTFPPPVMAGPRSPRWKRSEVKAWDRANRRNVPAGAGVRNPQELANTFISH